MTRISKNLYESPEMEEIRLTIENTILSPTVSQCTGMFSYSPCSDCSSNRPRSMHHYDSSDMEDYE